MFYYSNLFLVILCLCIGCNPQSNTKEETSKKESQQEKKVEFTTISQGANSGHNEPKDYTITTEDAWKELWAQVHANMEPKPELPKVDFTKEMVIAVFKGQQSSGGHSISVTEIIGKGNDCAVKVKEVSPDPGGMMSMGFSQPYHIVKLPKMATVSFKRP